MSEAVSTEIFASASVTAAGNTAAFKMPTGAHLMIGIDVTVWNTAGPVFFFQVSDDGGTTWYDWAIEFLHTTVLAGTAGTASINQASWTPTAAMRATFGFKNLAAATYRLRWTVASGNATFSASATVK